MEFKYKYLILFRLQIAFGAFKEYILCVKSMLTNSDELVVRAATIIKSKSNIFLLTFENYFIR